MTAAIRRTAALAAATLLAMLLSGCLLTSETLLVGPEEAVALFPASFAMHAYKETDGVYHLSEDEPGLYTRQPDNGYLSADASMTVYFFDYDEGRYLLELDAKDGAMYGFVRHQGDLLELGVLVELDTTDQIAAAGKSLPDSVRFEDEGAIIEDRAGLDAFIDLVADGTIKMGALLAWIGDAPAPERLIAADGWYAPAP